MKKLKDFKIKENQKNYEHVILFETDICTYILMWKWTTMREYRKEEFCDFTDAIEHYEERKRFAILCN